MSDTSMNVLVPWVSETVSVGVQSETSISHKGAVSLGLDTKDIIRSDIKIAQSARTVSFVG